MIGHLEGLTEQSRESIINTISEYCTLPPADIQMFYENWRNHPRPAGNPNGYFADGFRPNEFINDNYRPIIHDNARFFGIDFPYWFDWNSDKIKLLVVGINPLRNERNFNGHDHNEILINSGWGSHNDFDFNQSYSDFFHGIENTHRIFLTDYQKIYFDWNGRNSYSYTPFKNDVIHQRILNLELEIIQPDIIICFGNAVANSLGINRDFSVCNNLLVERNYNNIPFYQFPHFAAYTNCLNNFFTANPVPPPNFQNATAGAKFAFLVNNI